MKVFQTLISVCLTISCLFVVSEAKKDDEEATARAIRDMQAGMAGLQEVSNNPAMLAQLMRDLQVSVVYSHLMTGIMSEALRVFRYLNCISSQSLPRLTAALLSNVFIIIIIYR
jgi:endonuclease/exonuclease/phosphatase family metal-dependent hydrolase